MTLQYLLKRHRRHHRRLHLHLHHLLLQRKVPQKLLHLQNPS
jgi:hypothetical protein